MKFFRRTAGYTLFGHKKIEEISEELKAEPTSWPETKKIQIKFATTRNKKNEQQGAKNNAEL